MAKARRKGKEESAADRLVRARRKQDERLNAALNNVVTGGSLKVDQSDRFGVLEIDNPSFDPGAPNSQVRRYRAVRSLRDDPLAALHNSRKIDDPQFYAGRHWQKALELSEIGSVGAIDTTKDVVDGGKHPESTISDKQLRAFKDLDRARSALGLEGHAIVIDVLAQHMTIRDTAERRGFGSESGYNYIGKRFRECLDTLATIFGYTTKKKPQGIDRPVGYRVPARSR